MNEFIHCVIYLAFIGAAGFLIGRILPKTWFSPQAFPYKTVSFEQNGKRYERLGIRKWKDRVPDMSRIFPWLMPSKQLPKTLHAADIKQMLTETCIAEFIHTLLMIAGFGCVFLWDGIGGWICFVLFALGNLPFNLIQRYNRPKLMRLMQKIQAKESNRDLSDKKGEIYETNFNLELQYRTGS